MVRVDRVVSAAPRPARAALALLAPPLLFIIVFSSLLLLQTAPARLAYRLDSASSVIRGTYGRDTTCQPPAGEDDNACHWGSGVANMLSAGFNVVQTDPFIFNGQDGGLRALGAEGLKGIVWMGGWSNSSCSFAMNNTDFATLVDQLTADSVAHAAIYAYYVGDEPRLSACPTAPAAFAARTSLLHAHDAIGMSYTVIQDFDSGGSPDHGAAYYNKWMGTVDVIGFDVYPCSFANGVDFNLAPPQKTRQPCDVGAGGMISTDAGYVETAGFGGAGTCTLYSGAMGPCTPYLALLQDFQDCYYELPTNTDLRSQAQDWNTYGTKKSGIVIFSWNFYGNPCTPPSPQSPISIGVQVDNCAPDPATNPSGIMPSGTPNCVGNSAELLYDNCHYFDFCQAPPPTGVVATAAQGSAILTWTPPSSPPSPITGYLVTPYVGSTPQTPALFNLTNTLEVIFGLTNGTAYTFTVASIDHSGPGSPSGPSNAVTPLATLRQPAAQGPGSSPESRTAVPQSSPAPSPSPRVGSQHMVDPLASGSSSTPAPTNPMPRLSWTYLLVLR
jgi:hypothetical protein